MKIARLSFWCNLFQVCQHQSQRAKGKYYLVVSLSPYWTWEGSIEGSSSQRWSLDSRGSPRDDTPEILRHDGEQALQVGLAVVQSGNYEQAVVHLQHATLSLDPRDPRCIPAFANLGLALLHTAKPLYAVQALLRARAPGAPQPEIEQLLETALAAAGLPLPRSD